MLNSLLKTKPLGLLLEDKAHETGLRRILGPVQLTALGIGAIIGTGIFILIGEAARDRAGPAVILSFVVAGFACALAAVCYAELASMVPVAGSAYTYAYATLGEIFAWIIGWDLILEYAVGGATVAHGWSAHFQSFIPIVGLDKYIPSVLSKAPIDYLVQAGGGHSHGGFVATGSYIDLPAVLVTLILTAILVKGIRESAGLNALMVAVKLIVVLMVIGVGVFYIKPANWHPFAPFGYTGITFFGHTLFGQKAPNGEPIGMFAGAAIIFFSYLGFDSVSVHTEEARRPARDVPIGIIASLIACTLLYFGVAIVLTGMVPNSQIDRDAAIVDAFRRVGLPWMQYLVAGAAMTGITSVLLVMMLSQPRIMLAMARDGLVPKSFFGDIHPKFRTPWKSTILTGVFISIMAGFLPLSLLAEMTNIGTLFAFVIVCTAVPILRKTHPNADRPFRVPFGPLLPVLGVIICVVLMFSLPVDNWWRLVIWLVIGLAIYFLYGRKHSNLNAV